MTIKMNWITGEKIYLDPYECIFETRFKTLFPPKYINFKIYF